MNYDIKYCYYESPIGPLLLGGTNTTLTLLGFANGKMHREPEPGWQLATTAFKDWKKQLAEYFARKRTQFDLPYCLQGTSFQQQVLKCVAKVPYGRTSSYGEIAAQISNPRAVRAVGMANATNRLPIVIPCHRIIGKNGALTGFGGGLDTKSFLLALESSHAIL